MRIKERSLFIYLFIYYLHRVKLVSAWLVVRICEANIELLIRSDERLMVEMSVFDSLNGGQLHY